LIRKESAVPSLLRPRALEPGDLVVVTALSGGLAPGDEPLLARGVEVLERMGFRVRVSPLVAADRRRWWLAAQPRELAGELNALLRDPEVRAIVSHTGGRATLSYVDLIDLDAVRADPKPILGYSDISALHLVLYARTGLVGLHSDIATHGFGGDWYTLGDETRRQQLIELYRWLLTRDEAFGDLPAGTVWESWRSGRARGPLVGGLLNRLVRVQATRYALNVADFDGAILFWEEADTNSSAVWTDLQVLRQAGILDRIAAMVVGIPADVTPAADGPDTLRDVVLDVIGDRDIPVLGHVDFGHASPNLALPVGVRAALDADARSLALLEPAVVRP
jgi:muramoyltetrapeptide carboxypeptidase